MGLTGENCAPTQARHSAGLHHVGGDAVAYPAHVSTVTVTGKWAASDGTGNAATGYVSFTPNVRLQDGVDGTFLEQTPLVAPLVAGAISVLVMATDDPDLSPAGWAYTVTENIVGQVPVTYVVQFPAAQTPVDLSTKAPLVPAPGLVGYVALSAVAAPSGVASLDGTGNVPLAQLGNAPGGGGTPSGTVVAGTSYGQASTAGVATPYSRGDHSHGTPALPTPGAIGADPAGAAASAQAASQPVDATLTALASLDATGGLVVETGADAFTKRTLTAGSSKVTVTNGSGAAGNPTIDVAPANFTGIPAAAIGSGVLAASLIPDTEIQNAISGAWWGAPDIGASGTVTMPVAGTACFVCIVPAVACTLAGLIAEISTADAAGVVRFGLASDLNGQPSTWLNDFGTAIATSIALIQPGSTPSTGLTAGTRYWVAIVPQSTTSGLVMRNRSSNERHIPMSLSAAPGSLNVVRNGYTATGWTGALSGAISGLSVGSVPAIAAKLT